MLLVLAGCQKLNYEKETTLDAKTDFREFTFEPPSGDQKISVKASSDTPVNVWLVLEDDKDQTSSEILTGKKPAKALGGDANAKEIDFEVTVPAKKGFVVFIGRGKGPSTDAKVKLNVKGR